MPSAAKDFGPFVHVTKAGLQPGDLLEPTGPYEDDPNVTDKRFPGNPTRP